jgi:DMSO reductase anchor subunit
MRERSLVGFTLMAQTAVGLLWSLAAVGLPTTPLLLVAALTAAAGGASLLHLGSPRRAWRALGNLRVSWLSREILFLGLFGLGVILMLGAAWIGRPATGLRHAITIATAVAGGGLLYSMARVYRLRTVPAWDTPLTTASFFLTAGSLGGLAAGTLLASRVPVLIAVLCLAVELTLEPAWRRRRPPSPAPAPQRVPLLILAILLAGTAALPGPFAGTGLYLPALALALAAAVAAAIQGRSAFYRGVGQLGI